MAAPPARRWEGGRRREGYYAPCLGVGAGEGVKDGVRGHAGGAGTMGLTQQGAEEGIYEVETQARQGACGFGWKVSRVGGVGGRAWVMMCTGWLVCMALARTEALSLARFSGL